MKMFYLWNKCLIIWGKVKYWLPLVILTFYFLIFAFQTANILRVFPYNNQLVTESYNRAYVRKVLGTTEDNLGYIVESTCNSESIASTETGYVLTATIQGDRIKMGDVYVRNCDYFMLDNNTFYFDDEVYEVSSGDVAFDVYIEDEKIVLVRGEKRVLAENSINFKVGKNTEFCFVEGNEIVPNNDLPYVYVTCSFLEEMSVYYDTWSNILIARVDGDFIQNYLRNNVFGIAMISLIGFFLIHLGLYKEGLEAMVNRFYICWYIMLIVLSCTTLGLIFLIL